MKCRNTNIYIYIYIKKYVRLDKYEYYLEYLKGLNLG